MQNTPCSVVLIAGFLGAGKTTLLKNILSWPVNLSGTALLVNEFGAVGIDGELLAGFGANMVEMANGCICCSLQIDFRRSLGELLDRFHPVRLLIEATGVADPNDILSILNEVQFTQKLNPAKTVTVVDADFWEARDNFGALFDNQIRAADLVLLNKVDLQPPKKVSEFISEIRRECPECRIMPTCHCRIDPEDLWGLCDTPARRTNPLFPVYREDGAGGHDRCLAGASELGFVPFSFETTRAFDEKCFRLFLASVPVQLYRIKGYVFLGDRWIFINHAGGKTEWVDCVAKDRTRLAFAGWQVDKQPLLARLKECLVK